LVTVDAIAERQRIADRDDIGRPRPWIGVAKAMGIGVIGNVEVAGPDRSGAVWRAQVADVRITDSPVLGPVRKRDPEFQGQKSREHMQQTLGRNQGQDETEGYQQDILEHQVPQEKGMIGARSAGD
jgi:hypothetical protein